MPLRDLRRHRDGARALDGHVGREDVDALAVVGARVHRVFQIEGFDRDSEGVWSGS